MSYRPSRPLPVVLTGVLTAAVLLGGTGRASAQSPEAYYTQQPVFRIPFMPEPGARLKEVQLYYSEDQARTWVQYMALPPQPPYYFRFTAARDGLYWFAIRTVDLNDRPFPAALNGLRASLRVIVDTVPPRVSVRPVAGQNGEVGVEWETTDENLDPAGTTLEYRLPGGDWTPITREFPPAGRHLWRPDTNGAVDVRVRARDRAGNVGERSTAVGAGAGYPSPGTPAPPDGQSQRPPGVPDVTLLNTRRIKINLDVREKGPSGVKAAELWQTRDGRHWSKKDFPGPDLTGIETEVEGEGLYGFTVVLRSGVDISERPPQPGEPPQAWVEVDLTKPVVRLIEASVGRSLEDRRNMTIVWTAADKNLDRQPITLSYLDPDAAAKGEWKTIAKNVENTGRYLWVMEPGVPLKLLVRVEATDRAGNTGSAQSDKPVIVDLTVPIGRISGVSGVSAGGR